jgi:broad specificity phosphatase PhoE
MSIFLIRHGETALNASRVLQVPDTPLSARGLAQARAVAGRVAKLGALGILSSDMARALMTAQAIGEATRLPVRTTTLLHERNFGDLRGQAYDSLGYDPIHAEEGPPNGESMPQFRERVARAFDEIVTMRRALGGNLAVISHGLVIRVLLERHLSLNGRAAPERLANTSVTVFDAVAPYAVSLVNCEEHLLAADRDDGRSVVGV